MVALLDAAGRWLDGIAGRGHWHTYGGDLTRAIHSLALEIHRQVVTDQTAGKGLAGGAAPAAMRAWSPRGRRAAAREMPSCSRCPSTR